jgi:hypothetical protein
MSDTIRSYNVRLELLSSGRFTLQVAAISTSEARAQAEWLRPGWKAVACRRSPYAVTASTRGARTRYLNRITPKGVGNPTGYGGYLTEGGW